MKAREIIGRLRLRLGRRRKELVRRRRRMPMRWSRHMEKKMEGEEFVYLVFRQHLCRVNLTRFYLCPENPPPIETLLFFPEKDLPVGMGAFSYQSQIYLMGGEKLIEGIAFGKDLAPPEHLDSLNHALFVLDDDPSSLLFCIPVTALNIPPTIGPKTGAKAVIIDGKIYAFAGAQYCLTQKVPTPRFECYDPSLGSWEVLPDPPFYDYEDAWPLSFLNLSVLGRRIYVHSSSAYLIYDVDRREWNVAEEYTFLEPDPFEFFGSIAECVDYGIFVAYIVEGLVAYSDASLTRYQHLLPQLRNNSLFPCPDPVRQISFIRYLGDGIFCFVLILHFLGDIHVTIFHVSPVPGETSAESESELLESRLLAHHVYDVRSACCGSDNYPPVDVFTMCQRSIKRKHGGLYRFGVGRRF